MYMLFHTWSRFCVYDHSTNHSQIIVATSDKPTKFPILQTLHTFKENKRNSHPHHQKSIKRLNPLRTLFRTDRKLIEEFNSTHLPKPMLSISASSLDADD